jgi:hypothetical protein
VARQTAISAHELRPIHGLLVQRVKSHSLPGAWAANAANGSPRTQAATHRVVEEDRAGILWTDEPGLQTRFAKTAICDSCGMWSASSTDLR